MCAPQRPLEAVIAPPRRAFPVETDFFLLLAFVALTMGGAIAGLLGYETNPTPLEDPPAPIVTRVSVMLPGPPAGHPDPLPDCGDGPTGACAPRSTANRARSPVTKGRPKAALAAGFFRELRVGGQRETKTTTLLLPQSIAQRCAERDGHPEQVRGLLSVSADISPQGSVIGLGIERSTVNNQNVVACVMEALQRERFSAADAIRTEHISYLFAA